MIINPEGRMILEIIEAVIKAVKTVIDEAKKTHSTKRKKKKP
jgi:hypothetical protein